MWCTKNLRLKPVIVQISSISSVMAPYSLTSTSINLSSILLASFQAPSSLAGSSGLATTEDEDARVSHGGAAATSTERGIYHALKYDICLVVMSESAYVLA